MLVNGASDLLLEKRFEAANDGRFWPINACLGNNAVFLVVNATL